MFPSPREHIPKASTRRPEPTFHPHHSSPPPTTHLSHLSLPLHQALLWHQVLAWLSPPPTAGSSLVHPPSSKHRWLWEAIHKAFLLGSEQGQGADVFALSSPWDPTPRWSLIFSAHPAPIAHSRHQELWPWPGSTWILLSLSTSRPALLPAIFFFMA